MKTITMNASPSPAMTASGPAKTRVGEWVGRFAEWLSAQQADHAELDRRIHLDRAVDHCDLEWRIRELDRSWASSGFGIGGSRF